MKKMYRICMAVVLMAVMLGGCGDKKSEEVSVSMEKTSTSVETSTKKEDSEKAEADSKVKEEAEPVAELEGIGTGEVITFGRYEQDNDTSNGAEPIEWVVLTREGDRTLVVSRYALDCKRYHEEYMEVTWENCTLREWLNDSFYNSAFEDTEKGKIVQVTNENPDSYEYYQTDYAKNIWYGIDTSQWGSNGGNATSDYVFLLSWEEVLKYFSSDDVRRCTPTTYAIAQGAYSSTDDSTGMCWWWLRSSGFSQDHAMFCSDDGGLYDDRVNYVNKLGSGDAVRPALWITE